MVFMSTTLERLEKIRDNAYAKMNSVISSFKEKTGKESTKTVKGESKEIPVASHVEKIKKGPKSGVNKSEEIRKYISENPNCRNKDVVDTLKKTLKIDVNPAHVSMVRKNMEELVDRRVGGDRRVSSGRAKTEKKVVERKKTEPKVKTKKSDKELSGLPMTTLCAKILQTHKDGLKLSEIAEIVKNSGYTYEGSKGFSGLVQNVYQALHNLSQKGKHRGYEGQTPVIVRDQESHRYMLNPKAKKVA
jgi:hypothetical protein